MVATREGSVTPRKMQAGNLGRGFFQSTLYLEHGNSTFIKHNYSSGGWVWE